MKGIRIVAAGLVASLSLALVPAAAWAYTESYRGDRNRGASGDRMLPIWNDSWIFDPGHSPLL